MEAWAVIVEGGREVASLHPDGAAQVAPRAMNAAGGVTHDRRSPGHFPADAIHRRRSTPAMGEGVQARLGVWSTAHWLRSEWRSMGRSGRSPEQATHLRRPIPGEVVVAQLQLKHRPGQGRSTPHQNGGDMPAHRYRNEQPGQ
jgi:hypothetical protein